MGLDWAGLVVIGVCGYYGDMGKARKSTSLVR